MDVSNELSLIEEAEECRRKALSYLGRPEGPFLLRVARVFDDLAAGLQSSAVDAHTRDA
jgi:hypothetical protein